MDPWRVRNDAVGRSVAGGDRSAYDVARELGDAHVGKQEVSHLRRLPQPMVGRPNYLRRRVAQQSPRTSRVGPAWHGMVRTGYQLLANPLAREARDRQGRVRSQSRHHRRVDA